MGHVFKAFSLPYWQDSKSKVSTVSHLAKRRDTGLTPSPNPRCRGRCGSRGVRRAAALVCSAVLDVELH